MRRMILALALASGTMPLAAQTVQAPPAPPAGAPMPPPMGGNGMMRADADGDGVVTRAEALAEAGARFDRLDANHDGRIDRAELLAQRGGPGGMRRGDAPPPPPQ